MISLLLMIIIIFPGRQKKVENMHGFWHHTGLQAPAPPSASGTVHLSKHSFAPLQYDAKTHACSPQLLPSMLYSTLLTSPQFPEEPDSLSPLDCRVFCLQHSPSPVFVWLTLAHHSVLIRLWTSLPPRSCSPHTWLGVPFCAHRQGSYLDRNSLPVTCSPCSWDVFPAPGMVPDSP